MALGSSYQSNGGNNGQNNSTWEASYYSRLRIKNPTENLSLSFTFWKGTLKVSINQTNGQDGKLNEVAYIHLSPTKARILSEGVQRVINDEESNGTYGVDTGTNETRGFIAVGRDAGVPFLFIAKVNKDGSYDSSQRFNFNSNYNYLLKVHDISTLKCQKEYVNNVEIQQFYDILVDYARSASGALGASFYDIGRYETAKTSNLIRKIAEKTGAADFRNTSYGGKPSSNSFFNNVDTEYSEPSNSRGVSGNASRGSRYQSIDDLENELG